MEVSEQIIQVLNAVCEKLGIVIDWSQKNVLPYAHDLMRRVVLLEILTSVLWFVILGGTSFFIIRIIAKVIKTEMKGEIYFGDYDEFNDTIFCVLTGIASLVMIAFAIVQVFDIITCIAMPEMVLIEFAKSLMGG